MNIMMRISLSISLIAVIAQPAQAASYTDHAKKAGRIALHLAQTGVGLLAGVGFINTIKSKDQFITLSDRAECTSIGMALCGPLLYCGIKGLKNEIRPNSHPTSCTKNQPTEKKAASYADHAKKAAKIALYSGIIAVTGRAFQNAHNRAIRDGDNLAITLTGTAVFLGTPLYFSIKGLRTEICPNFNPIAWVKNKFSKKTE